MRSEEQEEYFGRICLDLVSIFFLLPLLLLLKFKTLQPAQLHEMALLVLGIPVLLENHNHLWSCGHFGINFQMLFLDRWETAGGSMHWEQDFLFWVSTRLLSQNSGDVRRFWEGSKHQALLRAWLPPQDFLLSLRHAEIWSNLLFSSYWPWIFSILSAISLNSNSAPRIHLTLYVHVFHFLLEKL